MEMSETFEEAVKRIDKRLSKLENDIKEFNKELDAVNTVARKADGNSSMNQIIGGAHR
jgi:phage shock protein A